MSLYENLKNQVINRVYVHSGKFHADDVFSVALLKYVNPFITAYRVPDVTDDMKLDENSIICDIGCGKYDHHQKDAEWRTEEEGGVKYAAFGLLWRDLGEDILGSKELADQFDKEFVQIIDNSDNTGEPNMISYQISMFSPTWNSEYSFDSRFSSAVEFALGILTRTFNNMKSTAEAESYILNAIQQAEEEHHRSVLILDKFAPYTSVVCAVNDNRATDDKIKFVVYPSARDEGCWNAMTVKVDPDSNVDLCPFPEEWAGLRDFSNTKFKSLTFCHIARFIIAGKELTDVLAACVYAMEVKENDTL